MADTKVSALAALTTPADADLLLIIDDPGGTPVSKSIALSDLVPRGYGQIYGTALSGTQVLVADTWTKLNAFAANGESKNTTPDHTADKITIANAGYYRVGFSVSLEASAALEIEFVAYWNSVQQDAMHAVSKTSDTNDIVCAAASGILNVASGGNDLELYAYVRDTGGGTLEIQELSLWCARLQT